MGGSDIDDPKEDEIVTEVLRAAVELTVMQIVTDSMFKVLDEHPELGISKAAYRAVLKRDHPEWLPDLKKEETQ